jgi:hypothetical protein
VLLVALPVASMAQIWPDHPVNRYYQVTPNALERLKLNFPTKDKAFIKDLKEKLIKEFSPEDVDLKKLLKDDIFNSLNAPANGPNIYNEKDFDDKLRKFLDANEKPFPEGSEDFYTIQIIKRIFEYRHTLTASNEPRRLPYNEVFLKLLPARRDYVDSLEDIKNGIRSNIAGMAKNVSRDLEVRRDVLIELGKSKSKFQGLTGTWDNFVDELNIAEKRGKEIKDISGKINEIRSNIASRIQPASAPLSLAKTSAGVL